MKRAFYFIFSIIAVAVACNKVDEPSSVSSISCWPISVVELDTSADATQKNIIVYEYDSINRLVLFSISNETFSTTDGNKGSYEIDSLFYEGQTNKVTKRNYYSLGWTLLKYDTYIYDMFGRVTKITRYEPYSANTTSSDSYNQNNNTHKGTQPTVKSVKDDVPFILKSWIEYSYASINAKFPSLEKDYTTPNTLTKLKRYKLQSNNLIETSVYNIINADTTLSLTQTATYERYNNIYKSLNCSPMIIDKPYSANNILTQILVTGTGTSRDSTNTTNKISYNEYNYPEEIRANENGSYTLVLYKVDSAALKKQLGK